MNLLISILLSVSFIISSTKGDMDKQRRDVLFIGDSITESDSKTKTYAQLIKESNRNLKVDIIAFSGRRTEWMMTMLESTLNSIHYNRVYIYGGINDMHSDVDVISAISNIQSMVDMVNESGGIPIVIVGYDSSLMQDYGTSAPRKWVKSKDLDSRYSEYQTLLEQRIRGGIVLPPLKLGIDDMFSDRIHPNKIGHQKLKTYIAPSLQWNRTHHLYITYESSILRIPLHMNWKMEIPLPKFVQIDTTTYITNEGFRYGYNIYEFQFWEWRKKRIWRR